MGGYRMLILLLLVHAVTPLPQTGDSRGGGGTTTKCKEECNKSYLPVCGSDGKTYENKCLFDLAKCRIENESGRTIFIQSEGVCASSTNTPQIPEICRRVCPDEYDPACGTDRNTYYSKCDLSIAMCTDDKVQLHHEGTCAGFSGRGARRPSVNEGPTSSAILTRTCPDTCTGGFRPVCGTNNITYGSDCYLQIAMCKDNTIRKRDDGVCAKDCFLQCDNARELVCGTDGITYTNDCYLLRARCKDPAVRRGHDGPCEFVERPECSNMRCGTRGRAICGSDGITYANQCQFDNAVCYNQGLLKLYDGPCNK